MSLLQFLAVLFFVVCGIIYAFAGLCWLYGATNGFGRKKERKNRKIN